MTSKMVVTFYKGGRGSGHHGHAGRPGKRGGSAPGSGGGSGGVTVTYDNVDSIVDSIVLEVQHKVGDIDAYNEMGEGDYWEEANKVIDAELAKVDRTKYEADPDSMTLDDLIGSAMDNLLYY